MLVRVQTMIDKKTLDLLNECSVPGVSRSFIIREAIKQYLATRKAKQV